MKQLRLQALQVWVCMLIGHFLFCLVVHIWWRGYAVETCAGEIAHSAYWSFAALALFVFTIWLERRRMASTKPKRIVTQHTWRTPLDKDTCDVCNATHGKAYVNSPSLDDLLVPPHPMCKNPNGCRCYLEREVTYYEN